MGESLGPVSESRFSQSNPEMRGERLVSQSQFAVTLESVTWATPSAGPVDGLHAITLTPINFSVVVS